MMFEIASEARGITVGKIVALFLYHLAAPSAPSEQVASRHASYRPCAGSCGEGTRHVLSVWHAPSAIHLVATTRAFALATQRERRVRRQCLVATDAIRQSTALSLRKPYVKPASVEVRLDAEKRRTITAPHSATRSYGNNASSFLTIARNMVAT
jgi:hypothetical protein